ncbi:MAG: aminotransferase class V-fold PLP-dependent enzyme [Balneolaceae bacterium]
MNRYQNYLPLLRKALEDLDDWRSSFGELPWGGQELAELGPVMDRFVEEIKSSYPFHHPSYAGQMLKPPHPAAWLAYTLAMTINPNNHALDGGPATSKMEKEVVAKLAKMAGYGEDFLGHLTSGGTVANLEALWISRELQPGKCVASTADAHYTHERMCRILNIEHLSIPIDGNGEPDFDFLEREGHRIGTVVVTMGTTSLGRVEPLHRFLDRARAKGIRVHVDAAYGGFFKLIAGTLGVDQTPWDVLGEADSIVIDPHKHGLQPYGCGSILFSDPSVGRFYKHDSPYTYFTSEDLHLGEITLECSRAGASAAALWVTLELLPLTAGGLGRILGSCRNAALELEKKLNRSDRFTVYTNTELDIVTYFPIPEAKKASSVTRLSKKVFKQCMEQNPDQSLFLSLCQIPADSFAKLHPDYEPDRGMVTILRSVLMKPEHENFVNEIMNRLEKQV